MTLQIKTLSTLSLSLLMGSSLMAAENVPGAGNFSVQSQFNHFYGADLSSLETQLATQERAKGTTDDQIMAIIIENRHPVSNPQQIENDLCFALSEDPLILQEIYQISEALAVSHQEYLKFQEDLKEQVKVIMADIIVQHLAQQAKIAQEENDAKIARELQEQFDGLGYGVRSFLPANEASLLGQNVHRAPNMTNPLAITLVNQGPIAVQPSPAQGAQLIVREMNPAHQQFELLQQQNTLTDFIAAQILLSDQMTRQFCVNFDIPLFDIRLGEYDSAANKVLREQMIKFLLQKTTDLMGKIGQGEKIEKLNKDFLELKNGVNTNRLLEGNGAAKTTDLQPYNQGDVAAKAFVLFNAFINLMKPIVTNFGK